MATDSIAIRSDEHSSGEGESTNAAFFECFPSSGSQEMLADLDEDLIRELIAEEVAKASCGSQVHLAVDSDRRFIGTVLSAGPDGVELMNCICRETVPGPHGQRQCKTSHVPFQSFETSTLTHFRVLSPPSRGFAVPDNEMDTSGVSVAEIVYRDGHRQRWGQPPGQTEFDHGTAFLDEE